LQNYGSDYRDDEQFTDFRGSYNDLGLATCLCNFQWHHVEASAMADQLRIEETFDRAYLLALDVQDTGFESLDDLFEATVG
jgi:hypothetical protein